MRNYYFAILLIISIILGAFLGYTSEKAVLLKPIGTIFIDLILSAVAPLIFFSIALSIARIPTLRKTGHLFLKMLIVFIATSSVASILALIVVKLFPLVSSDVFRVSNENTPHYVVPSFSKLLLQPNFFTLILISILFGFLTHFFPNKKRITHFLQSGEAICMRIFNWIMYLAPLGFFAYFAVVINEMGIGVMRDYFRIASIYYIFAIFYFVFIYSLFAYIAGKLSGVKLFWKNIFLPFITSIATCSSAASIPANLIAVKNMQIKPEIYETSIPIGAMIHKDGSVIGGIFKIAFLFGIFHLSFSGLSVYSMAIITSILVGTVMGAIPSGGMLGELLIITVYGFSPSTLMLIAAISVIIDPIATMLNVTGNCASTMLINTKLKYYR